MRRSSISALSVVAATILSCGYGAAPAQHVRFASLEFDVPGDWHASDTSRRGMAVSTWAPSDNERKESLVVVRSENAAAVARAGSPVLDRLLAEAQSNLRSAHAPRISPLTTSQGLQGATVQVDFIPPGAKRLYHRIHAVVIDGECLVHVIYTAADPDEKFVDFNALLNSLHHAES